MVRLKQIGIDVEVNGVIENSRLSFAESENEILRRLLLPGSASGSPTGDFPRADTDADGPTRTRGRWTVEFQGRRVPAANLKDAYRGALLLLNEAYPKFLEQFAEEKARARRFVAKAPAQLYLTSPGLARHHAKPLVDGWFFDTNLSTDQVARRIRIAARICGLRYGRDLQILNNLEQI